jgi:hypothetical protein
MDLRWISLLGRRDARSFEQMTEDTRAALRSRSRFLLGTACAASMVLFWLAGRWFGIPRQPDYDASLALQPRAPAVLLLVGFVLWLCVALSTLIAGTVRFDAGLFAGAVGLMALSVRGGPMRYVYQVAEGRGVFLALILELAVLYGFLGLAWFGLWAVHRRGGLERDALRDGLEDQEHTHAERAIAAATQVGTMALVMLLLAREDDKKQVLCAVFVSSFLATLLAYSFSAVRPSVWYWIGPLVVGVAGYAAGYVNWGRGGPSLWKAGFGEGFFAPLARPVPLDYASLGPAGAIMGYWMSRRWQRAKELEGAVDADAVTAAKAP